LSRFRTENRCTLFLKTLQGNAELTAAGHNGPGRGKFTNALRSLPCLAERPEGFVEIANLDRITVNFSGICGDSFG